MPPPDRDPHKKRARHFRIHNHPFTCLRTAVLASRSEGFYFLKSAVNSDSWLPEYLKYY